MKDLVINNHLSFRPNCALLTMMKDQFANYVVQKVSFSQREMYSSIEMQSGCLHDNELAYFITLTLRQLLEPFF
jgi:hypothetical protein